MKSVALALAVRVWRWRLPGDRLGRQAHQILSAPHPRLPSPPRSRLASRAWPRGQLQKLQLLTSDLDRIFNDPVLSRALIGVRVESLRDGQLLYARDSAKLVMPASNMKLLTMSVAADRLGWDFTFQTRLELVGTLTDGTLHGDLIVIGGGDPSISAQDFGSAPLFGEWADALLKAGIHRVDGRLIGDDSFFDDEGLGAGWAWDYLSAGYAAPSGALSYNENVAVIRLWPGKAPGEPVRVELSPPGHLLRVTSEITTGAVGSAASVDLLRLPGSPDLTIRGSVPANGNVTIRTTAVDNPTRFFVEDLRLALADRGITVSGGAWDIDDLEGPPGRRPDARDRDARSRPRSRRWRRTS